MFISLDILETSSLYIYIYISIKENSSSFTRLSPVTRRKYSLRLIIAIMNLLSCQTHARKNFKNNSPHHLTNVSFFLIPFSAREPAGNRKFSFFQTRYFDSSRNNKRGLGNFSRKIRGNFFRGRLQLTDASPRGGKSCRWLPGIGGGEFKRPLIRGNREGCPVSKVSKEWGDTFV